MSPVSIAPSQTNRPASSSGSSDGCGKHGLCRMSEFGGAIRVPTMSDSRVSDDRSDPPAAAVLRRSEGWTRTQHKYATQRKRLSDGRTTPLGGVQYESASESYDRGYTFPANPVFPLGSGFGFRPGPLVNSWETSNSQ